MIVSMLSSGCTVLLVGDKEIVFQTQDYQVGVYVIVDGDPRNQHTARAKSSYLFHRNLRSRNAENVVEDKSTPLEYMKPPRVIKEKFSELIEVVTDGRIYPVKGKHITDFAGGKFYVTHQRNNKLEPLNSGFCVVEATSGMEVYSRLPITKISELTADYIKRKLESDFEGRIESLSETSEFKHETFQEFLARRMAEVLHIKDELKNRKNGN